jgi:DNA-binding MarR family transcriptional regulator
MEAASSPAFVSTDRTRRAPGAEWSPLADDLIGAMAAIRRSGRLVGRPPELSELTGAQLDLVRLVGRRPAVSVAQAAAELRLAPNTVSTLVRQLTDAGLLLRRVDPVDRRIARLELTPAMQAKLDRFRDRRVALLAASIAELRPAERRQLAAASTLLRALASRLPDLAER